MGAHVPIGDLDGNQVERKLAWTKRLRRGMGVAVWGSFPDWGEMDLARIRF